MPDKIVVGEVEQAAEMGGGHCGNSHNRSFVHLDLSILDKDSYQPVIRRAHAALIAVAAIVMIAIGGMASYWIGFDKVPPLENPTARLIEYDPLKNFMVVEWSFDKTRRCYGERRQKLTEIGDEPPPRIGLSLPSETFTGDALTLGPHIIRRMIELPVNRPISFVYNATWAFTCNPLQVGSNAIFVLSPPVVVVEKP